MVKWPTGSPGVRSCGAHHPGAGGLDSGFRVIVGTVARCDPPGSHLACELGPPCKVLSCPARLVSKLGRQPNIPTVSIIDDGALYVNFPPYPKRKPSARGKVNPKGIRREQRSCRMGMREDAQCSRLSLQTLQINTEKMSARHLT